MSANWVDIVLLAGVVIVALTGWRSGVITTAASFAGFIGGALLGVWVVPNLLVGRDWPTILQAMVTLGGMLAMGVVGQTLLGLVGRAVRDAVDFKPVRLVDSASGMVVSVLAFLLSSWMVLSVAAAGSLGMASDQVRSSRAFPLLDQVMSGPGGSLLDDARELLASIDIPSLPFNPAALPPIDEPTDVTVSPEAAEVARASVVQVATASSRCASSVGSGVVVGRGRVVTNAHVVAGATRITVRGALQSGMREARLVMLDPATDVAVLDVPGLTAPAPEWLDDVSRGTDAVVAGYPGGGRLALREARVRGQVLVADDVGAGSREVHVFRGLVQPGNSGGALLDQQGSVIGLVFANAEGDERTGFALTAAEVRPAINAGRRATQEVSSGACSAGR